METDLNEAQKQVVLAPKGPILVVAGAGTGKTKTLVHRLAHLVKNGTNPESILLLTFTRRAAKEMLGRASQILDHRMMSVRGGTFHSFCHLFLRKYANALSLDSHFTILDEEDTIGFVGMARDQVVTTGTKVRFPKKETLAEIFSSCFNLQVSLEKYLQKEYTMFLGITKEIQEIKTKFSDLKLKHNSLDFDDLLDFTRKLLMSDESIRERMSSVYEYILVDEYQDTNRIQAHIACLLASKHQNILVVGDDAQCIYGFRGASVHNMLDFPKIFPNTNTIQLTKNYRSVQPILNLANAVLEKSSENYKKNLVSAFPKNSKNPYLVQLPSLEEEAEWTSNQILELYEEGITLSEMAVLFRAGFSSHLLEVQLNSKKIPYRKYGGRRFFDLAHVKDMIAYLKIIENPKDILSWNRILLLEDQIGKKYSILLFKKLESNQFQWKDDEHFFLGLPETTKDSFLKLMHCLDSVSPVIQSTQQILERILAYYFPLLESNYDDAEKRKQDLDALVLLSKQEPKLSDYLSNLILNPVEGKEIGTSNEVEDEFLTLSTIHSAKGLEWKYVFTLQVVEGNLPHSRIRTTDELEEERRLFYVAITRAKEALFLTNPAFNDKNRFTPVSRFLSDLPKDNHLLQFLDPKNAQSPKEIPKDGQKEPSNETFQNIQNYFLN
ncbi:ATP-dependent helicase [Leptospira biflexa]|uniref:ATP-dependent helicase n=1 Tax=Leptospira biflexa TaxID=172 RepID=UPI0010912A6C|nr:ATP-dependent helicase [Leptospira biflexa]TGM48552.1 ATP-dependent helicase [Leptospira biflexa]TGM48982.1 ATP-dependent helicase [Leptospira biflexa]TGM54253.1 ATP-dependent helicase [Leptospira biflexa]